ncbi:DNA polymerase III subunit delta [Azovibrio restrictus]|uniref:DNA polymerase III subunit delta n=1 Tax=Azovibrio restrictus TaxID=146938 RepID=UPI0026EC0E29|nr:DNA polymerase III subunit delta [Azovibrio restrictus]
MLIKAEQLPGQLERGLKPLYVVCGDSPLLVLEAADAIRAAARQQGYTEREVLTALPGFDWAQLAAATSSMSLFGGLKLVDLRIPNGKPGKDGSAALLDYCQRMGPDNVLLLTLPQLDWKEEKAAWFTGLTQAGIVVKLNSPPLAELPGWIAGRLRRQHQHADEEGLRFMAERVEGNLLAAHQEIQKLGLLYPQGALSLEQIRNAVLNVARYSLDDLREALLAGDLPRLDRTLAGLEQEGESPVLVLWAMTEEIRTLAQAKAGLARGQPQELVFKELRIWGPRQGLVRKALQGLNGRTLKEALSQAARLDRCIKGLEQGNVWEGFLRLGMLLVAQR